MSGWRYVIQPSRCDKDEYPSTAAVRHSQHDVHAYVQEDNMEASLQGNTPHRLSVSCQLSAPLSSPWQQLPPAECFGCQESGVTPNSSPSPTRRAVGGANIRWPALTPLKRKGGAESDGPPKKLFVTGVLDPSHHSRYALSASAADSTPSSAGGPLLSPPTFTPFTAHPPH
ncbi:uncharacterized protein LOC144036362 isoform X2 [Vanacampus margaritifer]